MMITLSVEERKTMRRRVQDTMNKYPGFCDKMIAAALKNGGIKSHDLFTEQEVMLLRVTAPR